MNWKKNPKTKIFKYDIGFNPQPSRDEGIVNYIEIHLCCNQYTFYDCWTDGHKYELTQKQFKIQYPKIYQKFLVDIYNKNLKFR